MELKIAEYIDDERESLADGAECEDVEEVLGHNPRTGTRIALGLLYLDDVKDARRWFKAASEKWLFKVQFSNERTWDRNEEPRVGEFEWLGLIRGIKTSVLSGEQETIDEAASIAIEEATNPALDELPGVAANPRVSAIAAMASVLLSEHPDEHLDKLSSRLDHVDRPHDLTLYPIMDTIIDGLARRNVDAVERGINELEDYHEEFTVGSDISHFTEEAVNIDACTFIVLARRMGMDVRVDSEYVPDGVYDDAYYPIGE